MILAVTSPESVSVPLKKASIFVLVDRESYKTVSFIICNFIIQYPAAV